MSEALHLVCCGGDALGPGQVSLGDIKWDPLKHALFKVMTARDGERVRTFAAPFEEQRNWTRFEPRPGTKGKPCVHRALTSVLDGFITKWADSYDPEEDRCPPLTWSRYGNTTQLDLEALLSSGYPSVYYGPSSSVPKPHPVRPHPVKPHAIYLAGPGFPRPFPESLTSMVQRGSKPGTQIILSHTAGKADYSPCLLLFAPSNFPRARMKRAGIEDLATMDKGCAQVRSHPFPLFSHPFSLPFSLTQPFHLRVATLSPPSGTEEGRSQLSTCAPSTSATSGTPSNWTS